MSRSPNVKVQRVVLIWGGFLHDRGGGGLVFLILYFGRETFDVVLGNCFFPQFSVQNPAFLRVSCPGGLQVTVWKHVLVGTGSSFQCHTRQCSS